VQRWPFLFVGMLAAAAATAALGQTAAPGTGPAGAASQTHSSIPNFSTTWVRLSLPVPGNRFPGDGGSFPEVDSTLISLALRWTEGHGWSSSNPCGATYLESG
jgi:hypothetical protein